MVSSRLLYYNFMWRAFVLAIAVVFVYFTYNFLKANLVVQYGIMLVIGLLLLSIFLTLKDIKSEKYAFISLGSMALASLLGIKLLQYSTVAPDYAAVLAGIGIFVVIIILIAVFNDYPYESVMFVILFIGLGLLLSPDASGFVYNGIQFDEEEKYSKAIGSYKWALEIDPNHVTAWFRLGVDYIRTGRYSRANDCFDEAIRIQPDNPDHWIGKGFSQIGESHYQEALMCFNQTLTLDPTNPIAREYHNRLLNKDPEEQMSLPSSI